MLEAGKNNSLTRLKKKKKTFILFYYRVFQEMLYGITTGFGSPQMPVAELLARGLPSLPSQQQQKTKSSNFLQVPDIETPR